MSRPHAKPLFCALALGAALLWARPAAAGPSWPDTVAALHDGLDAAGGAPSGASLAAMAGEMETLLALARAGGDADLSLVRFPDLHRLALEARKAGAPEAPLERYEASLRALDYAQYAAHDFKDRPSTRWIVAYGKALRPGGGRVDKGWISRATRKVCVDTTGVPQPAEAAAKKICEQITYDEYTVRIPDVEPRDALAYSDEVPGQVLNDRIREEFGAPLDNGVARTHRTLDFYVSNGYMELYRVVEKETDEEILVREENARSGKYVKRSDGLLKISSDGRGGSYYTLIGSADTLFGDDFLSDKREAETVKSLAIVRQYVALRADGEGPEEAAREAAKRGLAEYRETQVASAVKPKPVRRGL